MARKGRGEQACQMVRDLCICDKHHNWAGCPSADMGDDTHWRSDHLAYVAVATTGKLNRGVANDGDTSLTLNP